MKLHLEKIDGPVVSLQWKSLEFLILGQVSILRLICFNHKSNKDRKNDGGSYIFGSVCI